jgi:hypothetical protein
MNTSDKVIKLSNQVRDKYQWKLNIIEKKKFMYSDFDMVFKLLSNSLSRIFTTLENVSGTKCAAVYLDFSALEGETNRFSLKKINFAFKRNEESLNEEIENIVDHCFKNFVDEDDKFIMPTIRKKIQNLSLLFETNEANQGSESHQDSGSTTDFGMFQNLSNLIFQTDIKEFAKYPAGELKQLHYLLLVFFDTLVVRDIFQRHFVKDVNFKIERAPKKNNDEIHPDSHLASVLFNNKDVSNGYIGTTYLCCVYCTILLDCYAFDFAGISDKFELVWSIPDMEGQTDKFRNFDNDISKLDN